MLKIIFLCFTIFYSSPKIISSYELYDKMENDEYDFIFDTRIFVQYEEERIMDAVWVGEKNILLEIINKIDKKSIIILYCDFEDRSEEVYKILRKRKFKNLYILSGGFEQWRKDNFPIDSLELYN